MQTFLRILLEAFLCPWPRLAPAGCPEFLHLTETKGEKPTLKADMGGMFGGRKSSPRPSQTQAAVAAYTPPPVEKPTPIPPPATVDRQDQAMQQQDMTRQMGRRNGYNRTLLAGESNQTGATDTGRKTLLG